MKTNMLSTSVKNANHIYATVRNTMIAAVLTLLGTGMASAGTYEHTVLNLLFPILFVSVNTVLFSFDAVLSVLEKNYIRATLCVLLVITGAVLMLMMHHVQPNIQQSTNSKSSEHVKSIKNKCITTKTNLE